MNSMRACIIPFFMMSSSAGAFYLDMDEMFRNMNNQIKKMENYFKNVQEEISAACKQNGIGMNSKSSIATLAVANEQECIAITLGNIDMTENTHASASWQGEPTPSHLVITIPEYTMHVQYNKKYQSLTIASHYEKNVERTDGQDHGYYHQMSSSSSQSLYVDSDLALDRVEIEYNKTTQTIVVRIPKIHQEKETKNIPIKFKE